MNEIKLFVCLVKERHDKAAEDIFRATSEEHRRYMQDLWQRGILWAGGPSTCPTAGIEIYAVDSVEEAMKAQRNSPLYVKGALYDDFYYEWHPKLITSREK
jgi:uncharacterized protein YciI